MKAIQKIADAHGLWVLEDAAQAIGAKYNDHHAGSMGNAAALSFYPTKNLGAAGEGGAVLTNDDALAERVKLLRCHGMVAPYKHLEVGINSHLHTLQASILRVKLKHLNAWNSARRDNAAHYDAAFAAIDTIQEPYPTPSNNVHVYHQYVIRVSERDKLAERLKAAELGYGIFYPIPLHRQPCFTAYCADSHCPEADKAAQEVLALPIYPELTKEQLDEVLRVVVGK
jgi:dTDP-4-amino-4,6-dideoxygalactose transaminase